MGCSYGLGAPPTREEEKLNQPVGVRRKKLFAGPGISWPCESGGHANRARVNSATLVYERAISAISRAEVFLFFGREGPLRPLYAQGASSVSDANSKYFPP